MNLRFLCIVLTLMAVPVCGADLGTMVVGDESVGLRDIVQLSRWQHGWVASCGTSPDGKTVVFIAAGKEGGHLWSAGFDDNRVTAVKNGVVDPESVTDAALQQAGTLWLFNESRISWSADGKLYALCVEKLIWQDGKRVQREDLVVLDTEGKEVASFTVTDGFSSSLAPVFSPDGRKVAFAEGGIITPAIKIVVCDLDKNTAQRYDTQDYNEIARWTDDNLSIQYWTLAPDDGGDAKLTLRELTLSDSSDKVIGQPAPSKPLLSPDGKMRLVSSEKGLRMEDHFTGEGKIVVRGSWPGLSSWSTDGRMIVYALPSEVSDQSGERTTELRQLWLLAAGGKGLNTMLVTLDWDPAVKPSWSADGSKLAFVSRGRLFVADIVRLASDPEDKLRAGVPLTEEEEKTMILANARKISEGLGQFLLSQNRMPVRLEDTEGLIDRNLFLHPVDKKMIFKYLASPGAAISTISMDSIVGEMDAGHKWRIAIYLGERVEVVDKK